jgi:hypothetical protein
MDGGWHLDLSTKLLGYGHHIEAYVYFDVQSGTDLPLTIFLWLNRRMYDTRSNYVDIPIVLISLIGILHMQID